MSVTISGLPAAPSALSGSEQVPIVQSGATVRTTTQALANFALSAGSGILLPTQGGTGLSSYVQGDLIYATGATTLATLAKNVTATRYLSNTGPSNAPAWAQVDLASGVTGALAITNGGTGQVTANDALNALLPDQGAQAGNFLTTDGANTSWAAAGGALAAPDLVFIADTVGVGATGYSNSGTIGGLLIFQSLRLASNYGFIQYSLLSVAPSEMEFRAVGTIVSQGWFTSLNVEEWGQTFATTDATFSNPGGDSLWHWTIADADYVPLGQYTIRFTGNPA